MKMDLLQKMNYKKHLNKKEKKKINKCITKND